MLIETPLRNCQCVKPNCNGTYTHRHHKACETMWLRAFVRLAKTKRFKAFVKRYKEFRSEDVLELCDRHHEEIHHLYGAVITKHIRKKLFRPIKSYTWKEAEELMQVLREYCDKWAVKETKGMSLKKFARNW